MLFSFIILSVFFLFSFWVFSISWRFFSFSFPFSRNFGSSFIFGFSFGLRFWWVWMGGQRCGAYFTTVLYMENWCEETFGRLTLGEPDFSINDAVCLSTHPKPTMIDCLGVLGKLLVPIFWEVSFLGCSYGSIFFQFWKNSVAPRPMFFSYLFQWLVRLKRPSSSFILLCYAVASSSGAAIERIHQD